ncbi:MAG: tetratricopeptide repeat protein [Alphaproteobacteria bacterium]|uniref:Tetratricopeptide repeat protein n=1 Tax=Candidatus Nitrobium versatile TaxID=2884831 RepID=A0A953J996_9BACT|nr:tetratricopeptide repeat protein [Candidatus Nitrobium versatile]
MRVKGIILFLLLMGFSQVLYIENVEAEDIGLAKEFYSHNLKYRALEMFIEVLNNPKGTSANKAEALYYMGQISFDNGHYSIALNDWQRLVKNYPSSPKAIEIKERLSQLREIFAKVTDASLSSVIAQSYIRNGDFWSKAEAKFMIDSSWLPMVELAIQWYDRTLAEFPGTDAAEMAFARKMFVLLGWEESGRYGSSYGIKNDFSKYMPQLLKTFDEFEAAFPSSSYLQGFRYQIAQAYWNHKDWDNTRNWLNKIVEKGQGHPSFYTETAKARLNKIEY